jgi:trans-aconitate methyltransferase
MFAECYPSAKIRGIEISSETINRAREKPHRYNDRIELINADIIKYAPEQDDNAYHVSIWSEAIYYVAAQRSINETYDLLESIIGKLKP